MITSAERVEFGIDWRLPGLKDGPELGARLIELAERAARAHLAQCGGVLDEAVSGRGETGARIAPRSAEPSRAHPAPPAAPTRGASVRWSGVRGDRA